MLNLFHPKHILIIFLTGCPTSSSIDVLFWSLLISLPHGLFVSVIPLLILLLEDWFFWNKYWIIALYINVTFLDIFLIHFQFQLLSTSFKVLLCKFCSLFMKNVVFIKTFSVDREPLILFFLQLCKKRFTQLNILSVLRKIHMDLLVILWPFSISDSPLLVVNWVVLASS